LGPEQHHPGQPAARTAGGRARGQGGGEQPIRRELFTHIHYVRLVFVFEDAPEFARKLPEEEWAGERDPERIAQLLNESAKAVRDAIKSRVEADRDMDLHYDHPVHHGQIKLALKLAGRPISERRLGRSRGGSGCARSEQSSEHSWYGGHPKSAPPFAKTKPQRVGHPGKKLGRKNISRAHLVLDFSLAR
jgi:hypothetical protein